MINYQLLISGRVQGVGFRWATLRLAQHYHLAGLVKNLTTGQVYVEVQGPTPTVQKFIDQLQAGPTPYAKVTKIEKTRKTIQDYHNQFFITR